MNDTHVNESILSEEILEDQKKNRIDHMTYLPDMQNIGSDIMDQVIDAMGEVGMKMDVSLRETSMGGVATSPKGLEIAERLGM